MGSISALVLPHFQYVVLYHMILQLRGSLDLNLLNKVGSGLSVWI